jgi:hypothetical protein
MKNTVGEIRTIDRYEVGQELDLHNIQRDKIVDQLSDIQMIKKMLGTRIFLSPETKEVLDTKKELDRDYLFSTVANGI